MIMGAGRDGRFAIELGWVGSAQRAKATQKCQDFRSTRAYACGGIVGYYITKEKKWLFSINNLKEVSSAQRRDSCAP